MMSSGEKARASREKPVPPAAPSPPPPQRHIQATAEQIRLAQMIYDKNDADFEDKVNQLMEVTGKNQDECMVALHDCNEDVSRAINFLLESTSDMTSWEMVGKKKPLVKDGAQESKENKENREKKERESSKGSAGRKGKGTNRNRQGTSRPEENGVEGSHGEKSSERSRRVRGGRGSGGRGRGRAATGSRFSAQRMGTFNPADYPPESGTGSTTQAETWDSTPHTNNTDGTVAWRSTLEDWAAEDWSEDVSLSETKVFTSSCAPAAENHIAPGQSLDVATLLQKPPPSSSSTPSSSSQSLVFTNSHHTPPNQQPQPPHGNHQPGRSSTATSYAHAALSSVLVAGFGDLGQSQRPVPSAGAQILGQSQRPVPRARAQILGQSQRPVPSAGAQILEQLKGPGLGPLPLSQAAHAQGGVSSLGLSGPPHPPSSWDMKASQSNSSSLSSQFSREFVRQPEPSLVLSQLVQRHSSSSLVAPPSAPSQPSPSGSAPPHTGQPPNAIPPSPVAPPPQTAAAKPLAPPGAGLEPQGGSASRTQLKGQKRRILPPSKIPSSAVEMPGSDVPGLNLQFGALDFGSESALTEFGGADGRALSSSREPTLASSTAPPTAAQSQSSLYSKPLSESLSSPLSDPVFHSTPPPLSSTSSTFSSTPSSGHASSPFTSVGGSYEGPPHSRLGFSQNQDPAGPVMNGLNGARTSAALDMSPSSRSPDSPVLGLSSHSGGALSGGLNQEPPNTNLSTLNSHSSDSALGSSLHSFTSVENSSSITSTSSSFTSQPSSSSLHSTHTTYSSAHNVHSTYNSTRSVHSTTHSTLSSSTSSSTIPHLGNSLTSLHTAPPSSSALGHPPPSCSSTLGHTAPPSSSTLGHTAPPSSFTLGPTAPSCSSTLGLTSNGATANNLSAPRTTALLSSSTGKAPPNLSQGVPPLLPNQYIMGPGGLLPAYPQIYGYEDLHVLQSRLPMPSLQEYYGITFPTTLSGRDGLNNNPYSGEVNKFSRNDSTSPAPPTSVSAAPQPPQTQPPQPAPPQGQPHGGQAFLPPGYSYTGLPYYPAVPGAVAPSAAAFQYGPPVFVPPGGPPGGAKQHNMGLGLGSGPFTQQSQQQPPSGYSFTSGYEDLSAPAAVDYGKGYSSSSQAQAKAVSSGPKGVSVTSSNSGVPDISGSVYNKTQSFDKQGFHTGTPPPFSLPSALGGPGALNPSALGGPGPLNTAVPPGGYAPAPFLHILPHQLHHHLAQDSQGGPSQRQTSSLQPKSQVNKSYSSSAYWAN